MMDHLHELYMKKALELAEQAYALGEVPVGAIVVKNDEIIGSGFNRRESGKNSLAHSEIIAIDEACKSLGGWRLEGCTLYVTLEPCPMCAGAIINSRVKTVVYGAPDPKSGCFGSVCNFNCLPFNHHPEIISGVLEDSCGQILKDFFRSLRK